MRVNVTLPNGMTPHMAADTFSAYLRGDRANRDNHGPFWNEAGQKWQLDTSNDFWLHMEREPLSLTGSDLYLTCRYPSQTAVLEAMKVLFVLRYDD